MKMKKNEYDEMKKIWKKKAQSHKEEKETRN